jgi:hypothetical protein
MRLTPNMKEVNNRTLRHQEQERWTRLRETKKGLWYEVTMLNVALSNFKGSE